MTDLPATSVSTGFLLQRAHNLLRARLTAVLEGSGLNLGHVVLLATMLDAPGLSQRELTHSTGIEKSSMVIFVDALEREGWVRRAPHPTDRRAHALFLTNAGAARLAEIGPRLQAAERDFLKVLDKGELTTMRAGLAKLVAEGG